MQAQAGHAEVLVATAKSAMPYIEGATNVTLGS